jgi:hypothetical protein
MKMVTHEREGFGGFDRLWWLVVPPLIILLPLTARFSLQFGIGWPCVFKAVTGIPCPTCGGTRALAALSRLEPWQALHWNPLLTLAVFAALAYPFARVRIPGRIGWPLFWAALLLNWAYLILFLPR